MIYEKLGIHSIDCECKLFIYETNQSWFKLISTNDVKKVEIKKSGNLKTLFENELHL